MREASQKPNTTRDRPTPSGPGPVAHWFPVVLVLLLLGGGLASYRFEVGESYLPWLVADPDEEPEAIAPPAGLDLPDWTAPAPVLDVAAPALLDEQRIARALRKPLRDDDLGRRVAVAVAPLEGDAITWQTGRPFIPASTTKLLTAVAALEAVGEETRFTTRVVRGDRPREVVLVGGGDPYLASKPLSPEEGAVTYPARADVATLALAVAEEVEGAGRVRVSYDDSLFAGPADNPEWRPDYVADDIVSPITALMVDGGREPDGWGRYDDPSLAAARAFAEALEAAGVRVAGRIRPATAPVGGAELASVESAPLGQAVERMLEVSDNEGAEVIARHVGLAVSGEGSFEGASQGVLATLADLGVPTGGAQVHDGSGLSRHNLVSAETLIGTLRAAASDPDLRATLTGLPVAGFSGSLMWRFEDGPARARGVVRAKTGTLSGVHALAGVLTDRGGAPIVFVVAADRVALSSSLDARGAVDRIAASLSACRCAASP